MKQVVLSLVKIFNGVDHPQLTNLAQIKAGWGMSTVLLIETTGSDYYFKAGTRQGIDEWKLVRLLHERFPDFVHDILIVDEQRGWMITKKIDNAPIEPLDFDSLCRAFRAYAEIQLGSVDLATTDIAPELRVRDATWLRTHIDRFFSDDDVHGEFTELKSQLDDEQLAGLRANWSHKVDRLEASALPLMLNQEDLHFENILNTPNGPVVIDWADCAIAHPFFSYHRILSVWGNKLSDNDLLERKHVKQAYLDAFSHLVTHDQIRREIELTNQIQMLYLAFRWQENAREHRGGSHWGISCVDHAVRRMKSAIDEEQTSPDSA